MAAERAASMERRRLAVGSGRGNEKTRQCRPKPVDPSSPGCLISIATHFSAPWPASPNFVATLQDSFWTWRDLMYKFAARITPETQYAIARHLYIEMLNRRLHVRVRVSLHSYGPGGIPYDDPAEMAAHIAAAARDVGIGLTFLPVLYRYSGFGERPLRPDQLRFRSDPEWILDLVVRLMKAGVRCGVAPHSLRAVSQDSLGLCSMGRTVSIRPPPCTSISQNRLPK